MDPELIKRTQAFLLSRRDGAGRLQRNPTGQSTRSAAPRSTRRDAYIVWALVESDPDDAEKLDLKKEIAALKAEALNADCRGGKDAYFVALVGQRPAPARRPRSRHQAPRPLEGQALEGRGGDRGGDEHHALRRPRPGDRDDGPGDARLAAGERPEVRRARSRPRRGGSASSAAAAAGSARRRSHDPGAQGPDLHAKKNAHPPEAGEVRLLVGGKPSRRRGSSRRTTSR